MIILPIRLTEMSRIAIKCSRLGTRKSGSKRKIYTKRKKTKSAVNTTNPVPRRKLSPLKGRRKIRDNPVVTPAHHHSPARYLAADKAMVLSHPLCNPSSSSSNLLAILDFLLIPLIGHYDLLNQPMPHHIRLCQVDDFYPIYPLK